MQINHKPDRIATVEDFRIAAKSGSAVRGFLFRAADIGKIDAEKRTAELAFSSETPVDRGYMIEILDHGKDSVDMGWVVSGRAPLLADHDPTSQIGVVESAEIGKDRVGRAVVRFGKGVQADAYFQDVVDGIRTCISVGYSIDHVILEEETDASVTYRVMKWKPLEISLVSIPADQTVGIGRSEGEQSDQSPIKTTPQSLEKRTMEPAQTGAANANPAPPAIIVDPDKVRAETQKNELTRIREIQALGIRHNFQDKAQEFIGSGKSVDEFRTLVLDGIGATPAVDTAAANGPLGLNDNEVRRYSILRALRAMADPSNKRTWDDAAFEREVSEAVSNKFKQRKFQGNIQIPTDVLVSGARGNMAKRDLNVTTSTAGGYTVANELQPASFIELLRNRLLVKQMGARVLTGLEGNLAIPKQTGGATAYWLNEGGDATESQQSIGQVSLIPKTVAAYTEITRRMMMQSSLDVENFVRDDLAKVLALAIDKAALKGSGFGGEPMGILNTTGIGSVTITTGTPTFAKMVDLETEVAIDNADLGTLAYLASATDRGKMKQTEAATSTGIRVWTNVAGQPGVGEVNGYFAFASNQLAADEIIFGNWEDLIIGEWGILDLLVNPYAKDTSGGVRITAFQDVDCAVRHPESFARTSV
jgi:HK97 family phage major capsid protein